MVVSGYAMKKVSGDTEVCRNDGVNGEEFIRHDGKRVDVHRELEKAKNELEDIRRLRERNRELERFV